MRGELCCSTIVTDTDDARRDWTSEELDLIVADYFAMLAMDAAGETFVKSHRARALDEQIRRGHKSIEFKHMNISAVAAELGLPYVRGYRPMKNYQAAIFPAIDRYLDTHPETLSDETFARILKPQALQDRVQSASITPPTAAGFAEVASRFDVQPVGIIPLTEAPPPGAPTKPRPEGLVRLVRKYDPAARDHRNRSLGRLGEEHVFFHERARLIAADRADLARKIEWTSQERGDGAGYDIRSFEPNGDERLIEVKATRGGPTTPFYVTRTEREVSLERPDHWRLYRLHDLSVEPGLFILPPPLEASVRLEAESWKAIF
jgi:hypothetical protein